MRTKHPIPVNPFVVLLALATAEASARPDFGPHVHVLDPGDPKGSVVAAAVFKEQERAQFGEGRHAILLLPGIHELDIPVGFYTHVAGLGERPGDVVVKGHVWTDAAWMGHNATCNFWRAVENLAIAPPDRRNVWAVSQAAPMRRVHVRGDIHLSAGGWSSGGFFAGCRIDGVVFAGSQQQWYSRQSGWREWRGGIWNMVFEGCDNPPDGVWPEVPVTVIPATGPVREKPFLVTSAGAWFVRVPAPDPRPGAGPSWERQETRGRDIPLADFHLARPGRDTAATLNAALAAGRHLLITPGIYPMDETVVVNRAGTVVFGLGLPSLRPTGGKAALRVEAGEGVTLCGLMVDATARETESLVEFGLPGARGGNPADPVVAHDLFCRAGGYGHGKARRMVTVHTPGLVGDNFWLWRADHGAMNGWDESTCETGLLVEGDDVTIRGLFVEHTQGYQTVWNGERGRVHFYQSEMPYDPPSAGAWRSPRGDGFASYKVGDGVRVHEGIGLGVYHVFKKAAVVAESACEVPDSPGVRLRHVFTFRLGGGLPGSGIRQVVNRTGGESITAQKATLVAHPPLPRP